MHFEHLQSLAGRLKTETLSDLASARLDSADLSAAGWQINLSRHYLDPQAEASLLELAEERDLPGALGRLFTAEKVNASEGRPALHWALRSQSPLLGPGETVRQSVETAMEIASQVRAGQIRTAHDEVFRAIVHIGIGGSDFGPRLVADAFGDSQESDLDLRFCANLDPLDLELALAGLTPSETLVIGVSKSFGTEETLYNLSRARDWLKSGLDEKWPTHLALVTANPARATAWADGGTPILLDMPESVGGRFSIWSAGSFACMTALEDGVFADFLAGAAAMDTHVRDTGIEENAAIRLALLDYWNTSCLGLPSRAVLAYSRRLKLLPTYLQQLEMESNGKTVTPDGASIEGDTAPLLWGGEGTIGQHSYHQWLHQGSQIVPCEFILAPGSVRDETGITALTAHALAQAEVLANGRSLVDVHAEEPSLSPEIAAQKVHEGGRPSSFIMTEQLTPHALGALIALYEHRTYLAGVLWGLNSFDQWGVERGKTMASRLKPVLGGTVSASDKVTQHLAAKL